MIRVAIVLSLLLVGTLLLPGLITGVYRAIQHIFGASSPHILAILRRIFWGWSRSQS
jgi:hypothetical protein